MNEFLRELKRRNVFKVGVAYVIVAWVILQFVDVIADPMSLPDWFQRVTIILLAILFPIFLIFSWAFEVTPEGVMKTKDVDQSKSVTHGTGQRINKIIGGSLVLAIAFIVYQNFIADPETVFSEAQAGGTSIAVLPFVNMSDDASNEYFSDGISEELLNVLAKYKDLRVAARTSSFQFKGDNRDISDIGKQLGVDFVLEGSVRKAGNTVRITAQLIEVRSGFHMWSETYDRELVDVFAIQDEISAAIGNELRDQLALSGGDDVFATVTQATNPAAYEEYLLGKYLMNQRTGKTLDEAAEHFRAAIQLDPDYAPAYVNLTITYGLLTTAGGYGTMKPGQARPLMRPLMERAQALAPDLAETWAALYWLRIFQGKYVEGYAALDKAVELNPSYSGARIWKGLALGTRHLYKEQLEFSLESVRLDPLNMILNNNLVDSLSKAGRFAEAREKADLVYSIIPSWGENAYAFMDKESGNLVGALKHYLLSLGHNPNNTVSVRDFRQMLSGVGLTDEARRFPGLSWYDHYIFALNEGDSDAAIAVLDELLGTSPSAALFLTWKGYELYAIRDYVAAREVFSRAWEQNTDPELPLFFQNEQEYLFYADTLRKLGEDREAAKQFAMALRGVSNMEAAGMVSPLYYRLKGAMLLYQGRIEEALDALENAFEVGNRIAFEFNIPLFDVVRDHPRFITLQQKYQQTKDENRGAALNIICADDLPDFGWQPLAETCEGVSQ